MPCNTITTVKLELKNANLNLLRKAVESVIGNGIHTQTKDRMTWANGGSYNRETGVMTSYYAQDLKTINKAYSAEVVKDQAKRFGWQIKQTAQYQYQIIKR